MRCGHIVQASQEVIMRCGPRTHLGAEGRLLLRLLVLVHLVRVLLVVDLRQARRVEELEVLHLRHLGQPRARLPPAAAAARLPGVGHRCSVG